ncbi:hypothetical protein [Streptomyces antibioticus]|uniref:hypothetical protein n=1 Tax=Streptomyces antibioticus TaxID=1890 RepID=UPI003D720424
MDLPMPAAQPGSTHTTGTRVAELHRLCREDYAKGQTERAAAHTEHVPLSATHLVEPTDLEVAIRVAQQLLDSDQVLSLREALRLLLRAAEAEIGGTR